MAQKTDFGVLDASVAMARSSAPKNPMLSGFSPVDRGYLDYAYDSSSWASPETVVSSNREVIDMQLNNGWAAAEPKLIRTDNGYQVLFWLDDDPNRTELNRNRIDHFRVTVSHYFCNPQGVLSKTKCYSCKAVAGLNHWSIWDGGLFQCFFPDSIS